MIETPDKVEPSQTNCTMAEVGVDGPELRVNLPERVPVTGGGGRGEWEGKGEKRGKKERGN